MVDYAAARRNMVESQLRTNKVARTALLAAFESVPRELFVPEALRGAAYVDEDIDLGGGRYVMEPLVLARLLQAARPRAEDMVLDIGSGSGYGTAILARLSATVVALESDGALAERANRTLTELGIDNVIVVEGPLAEGYPKQGPYDVILLDGAVSRVPPAISGQLAEGGRLVTVVRDSAGVGRATLLQCHDRRVSGRVIFDAAVPILPGFEEESGFIF